MTRSLDDIAPAFKAAASRWPDAPNLQEHYVDLVTTFECKGCSMIELCKSFVESVCITVLNELGYPVPSNRPSTQTYLTVVLESLGLQNTRGASVFDKVLSAYNKLADALNEVRNQEGGIAHGKDGFIDAINERHSKVYLLSADTIIFVILQAYDGKDPFLLKTREPHTRFSHLNERIDAATQIEAEVDEDGVVDLSFQAGTLRDGFNLRVPASELLYCLDRQAYVDVLDALGGVVIQTEEEEMSETEEVSPEEPGFTINQEEVAVDQKEFLSRKPQVVTSYQGKYTDQISSLYDFIIHDLLRGNDTSAAQVENLTYSLLRGMEELAVIDWNKRNSRETKVRLFVKKLIKIFGLEEIDESSVEQIVAWLTIHIPGDMR
ncbi:abortive infection family protein [Dethiosulfovibrio sp. F2B]|uniref:abortive infection family protein n=1 Tax=Dethiosulfovibrio faecalis TaxID=2720018 RepID=UPI001F3D762D|nr:abortive infection family protein [Dethiosulfovibrio faecalis]MCF4150877.1 abortive infection family protein [Dethiosulfovibrio faecalis]